MESRARTSAVQNPYMIDNYEILVCVALATGNTNRYFQNV